MKKTTKLVFMSVVTIALCVSLIAGATFALFTSESSVNIAVSSGKVDIAASVIGLQYASDATGAEYDWQTATPVTDDNGVTTLSGDFANGGVATYNTKDNELKLDLITPGDAVMVTIAIENNSNVAIKYQTRVIITDSTEGDHDHSLDGALVATFDGVKLAKAGDIFATAWADGDTLKDGSTHELVIDLPWTVGNDYQGLSCNIEVTVYAVQGNAKVADTIVASADGLKDAIATAEAGDTISIAKDIAEVGTITVDSDITIIGEGADKPVLSDANISVTNNAALTLDNLEMIDNSYVNATNASAFTMENCYVDVNPTRLSGRSAFVVMTSERSSGIKMTIKNNVILSARSTTDKYGAAIFVWGYTADGSEISGNTFGADSDSERYIFTTIKLMNFVDGATVKIADNTVYGESDSYWFCPFDFYSNNSRANNYTVILSNNTVNVKGSDPIPGDGEQGENYVFAQVEANVYNDVGGHGNIFVLSDNKLIVNNEEVEIGFNHILNNKGQNENFVSWNVVLDEEGKIISGTFVLGKGFTPEELNKLAADGADITIL